MIKLRRKDYESRFFGRDIYGAELSEDRVFGYQDIPAFRTALDALLGRAAGGVYEFELDARFLFLAPVLEDAGFRLWDSRYRFITLVERSAMPHYDYDMPAEAVIRPYQEADHDAVLELNRRHLVADDRLISKFKSPFFAAEASERWFTAWVDNSLREDARCSILEAGGDLAGFFIYGRRGEYRRLPLFKGVLCAIAPEFRGRNLHLALQEHILHQLITDKAFYLDNTTQISNVSTVKNHFRSRRRPESIGLIFLTELG